MENPGVFAFSRENGALLWQLADEVVSNLAVDDDYVVGLTAESDLLVIDVVRGTVVNQMTFSTLESDVQSDYFVAAEGGVTAVYFGDSQELIVLRDQTR